MAHCDARGRGVKKRERFEGLKGEKGLKGLKGEKSDCDAGVASRRKGGLQSLGA
jgi:hypothetical protein